MTERTCASCDQTFLPRRKDQRFCSPPCGKRGHRDNKARRCAEPDCERPTRAWGLCAAHYKAQHPNRKQWKKNGDPLVRRAALRKRTQQRRAAKRDPQAELIDRDDIGNRDGWRCGLCAKRVARLLAYPHPMSASLDHIVPLSLGGLHTKANVQIAHLSCNVAKGNRVDGDQLLLFG